MDSRTVVPPALAGPVRLSPFRAAMLQPGLVGDPASARLFARPWRGVAGRLDVWERRGRLTVGPAPAVYLHEYTAGEVTVRGLVGLLDVTHRSDGPGTARVVPHEEIHPRQSDELADRMAQMGLQPAPILLVHEGGRTLRDLTAELLQQSAPARQYVDHAGDHHRVWALRSAVELQRLAAAIAETRALIADGHHRYAAYLRLQARDPGSTADLGLAMLVDQETTPLRVGSIHRVLPRVTLDDLQAAARATGTTFEYRPAETRPEAAQDLVVATDGRRWAALRLPHPGGRTLVEALHERLIPALPRGPWETHYHHDVESARADLRHRHGVALLLPPATFGEVWRAAMAGRLLPEKATSFQPKPHLGALMRLMSDGERTPGREQQK